MFFLLLLVAFSVTELLLYHLGFVAILIPFLFIAIGLIYLYYKNSFIVQNDMAAYEKRIKILELMQRMQIIILLIMSIAVVINFLTKVF